MKERMSNFVEKVKSLGKVDNAQLSPNFVYVGPSKMITTEVWKELGESDEGVEMNIIRVIDQDCLGALLFEFKDEITGLKYRMSWFLRFDESGLLLELIETKEAVETSV